MVLQQNQLNLIEYFTSGITAGTDEAGRGALAGPVVAAAVILPTKWHLPFLDDSKKLTPKKREELACAIKHIALAYGIGINWPKRIDQINILQASLEAMAKAITKLKLPLTTILIDGNITIPGRYLSSSSLSLAAQRAIVHGDALEPAISAASILAKTFRDHIMRRLHKCWPQYDFYSHKGYGTKKHFNALRAFGPCPMHRLSFNLQVVSEQHTLL